MADVACGVCNSAPKKYKCPTCALPYCSISCFKQHKRTHPEATSAPPKPPPAPAIPSPTTAPESVPRYLRAKTDFSRLATDSQFQALLTSHPTLLATLQRVFAATIEPDPEDTPRMRGTRGRGFSRGRGRGRGRGGRGGADQIPRWTPKKGDNDALRMLKSLRERGGQEDKEAINGFVRLVEELYGDRKMPDEEPEAMDTL